MRRVLFQSPNFQWIDIVDPKKQELTELATEFHLPPGVLSDSLNPKHLPKLETHAGHVFAILRHFDLEAKRKADSTSDLTRKVAIFLSPQLLITIHRKDQPFFASIAENLNQNPKESSEEVALSIALSAMKTYEIQIELNEKKLEELENGILDKNISSVHLGEIHRMVRQLSVFKRVLIHSSIVFQKWAGVQSIGPSTDPAKLQLKELKEMNDHSIFFCDELLEDGRAVLQLYLSLASHRTSEVMRVLTVFSVFFMPLTFIVGIYGMNFKFMPELDWHWGYPGVWIVMGLVTSIIGIWFYRRGWLSH